MPAQSIKIGQETLDRIDRLRKLMGARDGDTPPRPAVMRRALKLLEEQYGVKE